MALLASSHSITAKECMAMETELPSCLSGWGSRLQLQPIGRSLWGMSVLLLLLPALRTEQMSLWVVSYIPHQWQAHWSNVAAQY